jgi:hypothetical protein
MVKKKLTHHRLETISVKKQKIELDIKEATPITLKIRVISFPL